MKTCFKYYVLFFESAIHLYSVTWSYPSTVVSLQCPQGSLQFPSTCMSCLFVGWFIFVMTPSPFSATLIYMTIHWDMGNLSMATSPKKSDSPSLHIRQLPVASLMWMDPLGPLHIPCWNLDWLDLVQVFCRSHSCVGQLNHMQESASSPTPTLNVLSTYSSRRLPEPWVVEGWQADPPTALHSEFLLLSS